MINTSTVGSLLTYTTNTLGTCFIDCITFLGLRSLLEFWALMLLCQKIFTRSFGARPPYVRRPRTSAPPVPSFATPLSAIVVLMHSSYVYMDQLARTTVH